MVTDELRRSWRFMHEHAGWSTPPGRAACALALARAELTAASLGLRFEWQEEIYPDVSWMDDAQLAEHAEGRTLMLECVCFEGGDVRAALCGIHVSGYQDPYCRVIEAELASEALDSMTIQL